MKPRSHLPSEHRLARLIAWTIAVLAWLLAGAPHSQRSTRRQQLARASADQLARFIRCLIIIRAAQLLPLRLRRQRLNHAPAGFRGRATAHYSERRIAGVWLRRRLKRRALSDLLDLLRDWRKLGAELAHRRRKRLTRLFAIIAARPPAHVVRALAAPLVIAADSS